MRFGLAVLFFLGFFVQCSLNEAQLRSTTSFTESTISVSKIVSEEMVGMREAVIQLNTVRLQLKKPDDPKLDHTNLEESLKLKDISARVNAIQALETYGKLLKSLLNDTSQTEVLSSMDNFFSSVRGFQPESQKMSEEKFLKVTDAARLLTGWYMDYKKKEAIRSVVSTTSAQINELCDRLIDEFDYKNKLKVSAQYLVTTDRLLILVDELMSEDNIAPADNRRYIQAYNFAVSHKTKRENLFPEIIQSLQKLKSANSAMYNAFTKEEVSLTEIHEFTDSIRKLKEIKTSLKK